MKRRTLLVGVGACLAAAALPAGSQAQRAPRRIAFLHPGTRQANRPTFEAFRTGLRQLGYQEGRDLALEARWADGRIDRLPSLAAELAALDPAVIVTGTSAALAACQKATSKIPIVFATVSSPVEQGFVASLARPGGNTTGIVLYSGDLAAKNVELARQAFPEAKRLAILVHEADPVHRLILEQFVPSTRRLGLEPVVLRVTNAGGIERAFRELGERKAEALYLPEQNFMVTNRRDLIAHSLKARLPLLSNNEDVTAAGALMSYGTTRAENYRRAAALVDKILRGAKPAELPVEQPERFELVVNRRTATAIGVALPPAILLRADRVIE